MFTGVSSILFNPLGTATIYFQGMVEKNGRTYYHFIVAELNSDPYDEVYIDTETGGCEATEQASGEEASVSHDGTTLTIYAEDKKTVDGICLHA